MVHVSSVLRRVPGNKVIEESDRGAFAGRICGALVLVFTSITANRDPDGEVFTISR